MYSIFICDRYVWSDVFCLYLQSIQLMKKWLSLFVMPIKENDSCAWAWLKIVLEPSFCISVQNMNIKKTPQIRTSLSLYSMFNALDKKKYIFQITFHDQTEMTAIPLFYHLFWTMLLYLSIWILLKWVGFDKLLNLYYVWCISM